MWEDILVSGVCLWCVGRISSGGGLGVWEDIWSGGMGGYLVESEDI